MTNDNLIEKSYEIAKEAYAAFGVDTDRALETLSRIAVSLQCWQGDDVSGFESAGRGLDGGIAATGSYPGRARTPDELRADMGAALDLIPGRHRVNLHACYAETGGRPVDRSALAPEHFQNWMDWARGRGLGMDFNPTFFSHPLAASGFTLSHADPAVRQFWIEHAAACRRIGAAMAAAAGSPCVVNVWVPDGFKDTPVDRKSPRERLAASLDAIFSEQIDTALVRDAVESKLFGIGSESCVIGSHEFYFGYALRNNKLLCLDSGHFHPTEVISDKISSVLMWLDEILLHVSRGVRWDSDHVVTLDDELRAIAAEIVRGGFIDRVHIGLDFFDASINRVAAWVIGARNMLRALLIALLEPADTLRGYENTGGFTARLALLEEIKTMPAGAVWDYHCLAQGVPPGPRWLDHVQAYERDVLSKRAL